MPQAVLRVRLEAADRQAFRIVRDDSLALATDLGATMLVGPR